MQLWRSLFLSGSIVLFPFVVFPQKTVHKAPAVYRYPTGAVAAPGAAKDKRTNIMGAWIVFSDRSDNPTYQAPDGMTQKKTMNFMEAFYVAEEKGNFLHLYKFDYLAFGNKGKITVPLEDYGYAPKDKLLLWRMALVEPQSQFTIKALSVNSVDALKNVAKMSSADGSELKKMLKLYDDPGRTKENENDFRLYSFLYLFKKTDNSVLVSTQPELLPGDCSRAGQYVLGWASKDVIQEWSSRLCLEPNSDISAASERKNADIKVSLFGSRQAAESFRAGNVPSEQPLWNKDRYEAGYDPVWKRLPIMEDYGNDIIKTGVVSDVYDKDGQEVIQSEQQQKIEKEYNKVRDNFRKVNVVLVYDGSEAISEEYFEALLTTVDSLASQFNTANETGASGNSYRMGVVTYRDYAEQNCPDGNIMLSKKSLTTNLFEITNFMRDHRPRNCADKDKDGPQALYSGIAEALKVLKDHADETNIILIAGVAGNRYPDNEGKYNSDFLIRELVRSQCSIFAFQIYNEGTPDQLAFRSQIADLIRETSKEIRGLYDRLLKLKSPEPKFNPISPTVKSLDAATSPIPGTLMYADRNNQITPSDLVNIIVQNVNQFIEIKEDILRDMSSRIGGQGTMRTANPGMYAFLLRMYNVDTDLLQKTSFSNFQFFTEAYTSMKSEKLAQPLYQYVLFLRGQELTDLMAKLSSIFTNAGTDAEQREHLNEAFETTVAQYFGPDKVKQVMSTWTAAQLYEKISGLPVKSELMRKYKLNEFTDKKAVPPQELLQITQQINNKMKDLQKVVNDVNYKYSFKSNDFQYYWVPQKFMP